MEHQKGLVKRQSNPKNKYPIPTGKNYLICIGIDAYQNDIPLLYNALKDAQSLCDLLWTDFDFEPTYSTTLYNEKATQEAILQIFLDVIDTITDQDNLVIYFSGHGILENRLNKGYWLPVDAQPDKRGTYIANEEVLSLINRTNARHVVCISDSCFSGSLLLNRQISSAAFRQYSMPSRWVLTSGRNEPVSDGQLGTHSPFAQSLLQQLRYAPPDQLWIGDLCRNVLKNVAIKTDGQLPLGKPLHSPKHEDGEFVFLRKGVRLEEAFPSLEKPRQRSEQKPVAPTKNRDFKPTQTVTNIEENSIIKRRKMLQRRIEAFQEALIQEADPGRRITYEEKIEELTTLLNSLG